MPSTRVPKRSVAPFAVSQRAGRFGQQAAKIDARQQQVGIFPPRAAQAVAQHVGEDLRRGAFGGHVERGEAERFPQVAAQGAGLAGGVEPFGDGADRASRRKRRALMPCIHQAVASFSRQPTPRAASRPQATLSGAGHFGSARRKPVWSTTCSGRRSSSLLGVGADLAHQGQRLAIGAEQDVLAVVQRAAVDVDAAGAAAEGAAGFEQGGVDAGCRQFDGGGDARPAAADDGDLHAKAQVFQAIQSLRTGVSAMRWCRTWKLSRLISSSSVR